jgi:hypothetical protein
VTVDGEIGSVTYIDTVARTTAGWRIRDRVVQARHRPLNGMGTSSGDSQITEPLAAKAKAH